MEDVETMKRLLILVGTVGLVLILTVPFVAACAAPTPTPTPAPAPASHEITRFTQMTSPFGTSSYALSFASEEISKEYHPWLRMVAVETPGTMYEHQLLSTEPELWPTTAISSGLGELSLHSKGLPPFAEMSPVALRHVMNFCIVMAFYVTLDPNIKTMDDLKGKHVAIGRRAQSFWGSAGLGPFF